LRARHSVSGHFGLGSKAQRVGDNGAEWEEAMRGFVIQTASMDGRSARYYLLAADENDALASAAALLSIAQERLSVLREMAQWELDVFVPFPNELYAAP
jgi:hypothetical protein